MAPSVRWLAAVTMMLSAGVLVGCGSDTSSKPAAGSPSGISAPRAAPETDDHAGGPALSAEDQALADAQKLCPVTDEELGSHDMGAPVKLIVKGEPIFICCKGCEKKVNADPDKYLAKVAELKKANAGEGAVDETKSKAN